MDFDFKLDSNMIKRIKSMNFPRSLNQNDWQKYLGRKLDTEELFYLEDYKTERKFNNYITKLHGIATEKGLYIPYLTGLYGNCMFESLMHHELFEDDDDFRKNLAFLMYLYKDKKNLFQSREESLSESLSELFELTNEIEFVMSKNKKEMYKYNYTAMCQDLSNEFSWSRLPTQLIMMVISYFFNVKFHVISNMNDYEHIIDTSNEENPMDIYLGHIEELHYVPLEVRKGDPSENIIPKHCDAQNNFYKWAISLWESKNNYIDNESDLTLTDSPNNNSPQYIDIGDKIKMDSEKNVNYDD